MTMSFGCSFVSCWTKSATPSSSWATRHAAPVGRTAMSNQSLATSIPTNTLSRAGDIYSSGRPFLVDTGSLWPRQLCGLYDGIGGATTLSHGLGTRGETACPAISVTYKGERMGRSYSEIP